MAKTEGKIRPKRKGGREPAKRLTKGLANLLYSPDLIRKARPFLSKLSDSELGAAQRQLPNFIGAGGDVARGARSLNALILDEKRSRSPFRS